MTGAIPFKRGEPLLPFYIDAAQTGGIHGRCNLTGKPQPATILTARHQIAMKFLLFLSNAFINTMGITKPSPRAATRAAWIIAVMLAGVLVAVTIVAAFGLHLAAGH